jgi:hypothetical protein
VKRPNWEMNVISSVSISLLLPVLERGVEDKYMKKGKPVGPFLLERTHKG